MSTRSPASAVPTPAPAVAPPVAPILLVDDQRTNLQVLEAILEGVGGERVRARSGADALGQLLRREFAVVLMDVRMPELDGFETARLIRARPASRHLPIIFVTAAEPDEDATAQAYALGAVDFIFKPIRAEALRSKVSVFVELFRRQKETLLSRARYDSLVDFAPVGVFHADADGECLWTNSRWREIAGLRAEETLGRGWGQAIHPDDRDLVFREWTRAVAENRPFTLEYRVRRPDGKVTWVLGQARAELDVAGQISGFVGTLTDIDARKRAETELEARARQRAEELLRTREDLSIVVDTLPSLMAILGRDERYIRVNRGYQDWFGLRREEVEGRFLKDVIGPDAYARIKPHVDAVLAGRTVSFDSVLPYTHGRARHVHAEYVPRRDAKGEVEGWVALVTDVSESKRAEEELRQREQEFSDFFENAAVGCHWVGLDGVILRANRAELELMGYPAAEYVGRRFTDFHEDPGQAQDLLDRLSRGEVLRDVPARVKRRDGTLRDVLIDSSGYWKDGRFVHGRCFTRDVTELRRAERAQAHLAAIVESSQDAIVGKTLDGLISSWNLGAERLFGWRADEVLGRSVTLLFPDELRAEEETILARVRAGQRVEPFETKRLAKDGRTLDVSLTISPIKDVEGRVIGASKVARDITERRRAEEEIRKLNAELETRVRERTATLQETVRELDTFAYTVAHDLRAPLRAIHGFGQILLEEHARSLDEEGRAYLERIIQGGARMDALIHDLLKYSRLTREQIVLDVLPLESVVDRALADMAPELRERAADVRVERPMPKVRGHAALLGQAVTNLVSNAAKFVPKDRRPLIRLRAEAREAGRVRLWVEDNGIGIAREHQPKLFRIFERLHARDAYPGTGIGLAIVRRAAERMGGQAGVESGDGAGSRFWLDLGGPSE